MTAFTGPEPGTRAASFVEAARRYGSLGWVLIRLDGKVPKGEGWQDTRPEPDVERLAGLWATWGTRWNAGVVLGPSRLAVLEYDNAEGGERLFDLLGGQPRTPTVVTGSGRMHFYFTAPDGFQKATRDGIELRLGAHQCVLPPSEHPETGRPYTWAPGREPWALPLAEVPPAVLDYFAEARQNGAAPALPEVIPKGEIDTTLTSLAGTMRRRNASEEAILAALIETLKRCEPGHSHTPDDCRRIAHSVARYAPGAEVPRGRVGTPWHIPATRLPIPGSATVPPPYIEGGAPVAVAGGATVPRGTSLVFTPVTARALCARPDPASEADLLGPLLRRGARTIIVGDQGEGKTTLAVQWLGAVAEGDDFCGWAGAGGKRALVIDLEQGERSAKRTLRAVRLDQTEAIDYLRVPDGLELEKSDAELHALAQMIEAGGYAAVLLDPYYKAHRAEDPNAERPIVDLMRRLDALRSEYGFALLLPGHPRKRPPSAAQGPRRLTLDDVAGSGAVTRGAEVVVGIERLGEGYARLRFLKDREGELPVGLAWGLVFGRGVGFGRDPRDFEPERDYQEELLACGADCEWRTLKQWKAPREKGGIGAGEDVLRGALDRLVADGLFEFEIGPPGRNKNANCWRRLPAAGEHLFNDPEEEP